MRHKKKIAVLVFFAVALIGVSTIFFLSGFDRADLLLHDNTVFVDRNGRPLRFIPDAKGERHQWISEKEIPNVVKKAFLAAEDQRFYEHIGFDAGAIVRALLSNYRHDRIVSGASTITQQTMRLIYPRKKTYKDKLIEILRSVRMELYLSKGEILEQYLNRVPMGNNMIGIELAAQIYFGKSVRHLSMAEAALLASLPKAPGRLNPYSKNKDRLMERKDWVLSKIKETGFASAHAVDEARNEKLIFRPLSFPNAAPHLVDLLLKRGQDSFGVRRTAISMEIQTRVEQILTSQKAKLLYRGAHQAAAIVVHNPSMEVLALVGSLAYESKDSGFNNGAVGLRSAGSTLKPFVYAQALEEGYPVTWLLEDTLRTYKTPKGNYLPTNYDKKEYGPVTMRTALGNSLNVSAIKMLLAIGHKHFYEMLSHVGFINDPTKSSDHYGLGLVVGNPEVTLEQLAMGYAMLSNGGIKQPLVYLLEEEDMLSQDAVVEPFFSSQTSYIISDILSDPTARLITFGDVDSMRYPFRVSIKTGTSNKYRDGWAIGYTPEYTVGVWVGNFEGNPTYHLSGAEGAAPILKEVMGFLYKHRTPSVLARPKDIITGQACGISGMKPGRYCKYVVSELFIKGTEPNEECSFHTQDEGQHELPMTYASWVYDKGKKGAVGNYRLKGFLEEYDGSPPLAREEAEEGVIFATTNGHISIGDPHAKNLLKNVPPNNRIKITYPLENDRFVLNGGNKNPTIKLTAVSEKPIKYVEWFIDRRFYKKVTPPYDASFWPERGKHTITASGPDYQGDSISITVE